MPMVVVTKTHRIKHTNEKNSRTPAANTITPASSPAISGQPKFRFKLSADVLRQASSGPTPVRKSKSRPMGMLTLLKKGAPTLIFEPETVSENTGKSVPESTATQDTNRIKLLNRKLDSRETIESRWFSLFK